MDIGQLDAFRSVHDLGRMRPHLTRMRHRVPEVAGVVLDEEVRITHGARAPLEVPVGPVRRDSFLPA